VYDSNTFASDLVLSLCTHMCVHCVWHEDSKTVELSNNYDDDNTVETNYEYNMICGTE